MCGRLIGRRRGRQALSVREDILPAPYVKELRELQVVGRRLGGRGQKGRGEEIGAEAPPICVCVCGWGWGGRRAGVEAGWGGGGVAG